MAEIKDPAPEAGGFSEEEAPEEVRDFLISHDIGDKYTIILKQRPAEGGKAAVLRTYTNKCPTIEEIGTQWGPGEYILAISYQYPGMDGKLKPTVITKAISLPERAWGELHDDWLAERRKKRASEKEKEIQDEAQRARIFNANGIGAPPKSSASELEQLEKALQLLSKFGITPGGLAGQAPKKSFGEVLVEMAPVITALSPIILALVGKGGGSNSNDQLLNTLVTNMLLQKPPSETESMKQITGFLMSTMKQVFDMKEAMKPAEKESFVEKLFDKLVASGPMLASILKMTAAQRQNNFMVSKIKESQEVQALRADEEAQAMMIAKMDAYYGAEQTNEILSVMGFGRPEAMRKPAPATPTQPAPAQEPETQAEAAPTSTRDSVSGAAPMAAGMDGGSDDDDDEVFGGD